MYFFRFERKSLFLSRDYILVLKVIPSKLEQSQATPQIKDILPLSEIFNYLISWRGMDKVGWGGVRGLEGGKGLDLLIL